MPKLFLRFFTISTCKFIGICLSANSINTNTEIVISNSCISSLDTPKWFRQSIYCCRRIIHNFSTIESKSHPVKWMMSSIANINTNFAKLCFKYRMSTFSFHIISGFIKITNPWDMSLNLRA